MPKCVELSKEVMKISILWINGGDHFKMDFKHWPVVVYPFQIRQVHLWALNRIILDDHINTIIIYLFIYLLVYLHLRTIDCKQLVDGLQ